MPGRKMYKCQGTTQTAITAVCARVWTAGPLFDKNMKITLWHTVCCHCTPPSHLPPAKIPEHLSQRGSATSLPSCDGSSLPCWMLGEGGARLIVLAQTHSPDFIPSLMPRIQTESENTLFGAFCTRVYFGPCGESGHMALGGNSKSVTWSFLSQTKYNSQEVVS